MMDPAKQLLLDSSLTLVSHPFMYVKMLVQVGHRPLSPTLTRNLYGCQLYRLPGFPTYGRHMINADGKRGLGHGVDTQTGY